MCYVLCVAGGTSYYLWGTGIALSHPMEVVYDLPIQEKSSIRANASVVASVEVQGLPPYEFPPGQNNATLLYINV